ncbi:MAG: Rpn family recombination-promoting nuclease/putative transposase [Fibromonadaceae bacterium]|jgi:predicted transposase/invertase (TIGR01784 family)|nr:Rpn family recombination-promoting nuclease/putative transposase [Fibromonadaceae bacterium]
MEIDKGLGCFADLKLDMPFKKTFANESEKEPLIVMLNVFLARKLKHPIVDVHIKNPYAPGQTFENRDCIFDILCKDAKGNKFLVEVQVGRQAFFIKRVLFYACMAVTDNGKKGDWDFNYPPVYTLSFMDFDLDFKNNDVIQYLSLSNEDHPEIRYDYINMVFVRLPLFNKTLEECCTLQDKLIFSLRHAHELKAKPEQFGEGVFDKIFDIVQIARFSKEERAKYEASMINKRDQYAILKCARDEGMEKGVAIGEVKGEARGMEKVFSLLESGMSLAEAKKKLGLQSKLPPNVPSL